MKEKVQIETEEMIAIIQLREGTQRSKKVGVYVFKST